MKALSFPEANIQIAKDQEEYNTLPALITEVSQGSVEIIICFELDENEKKQVAENGQIWLRFLQPNNSGFHPIGLNCIKPDLSVINKEMCAQKFKAWLIDDTVLGFKLPMKLDQDIIKANNIKTFDELEHQYNLIEGKKSNLPRSARDAIARVYKRLKLGL